MMLSLFLFLYVLFMIYWWGRQGLFSAFLHLVVVIVAGALALAIWEPLAHLLLGRMPGYAWGVALVAPFVLLLIFLRVLSDKLIKANMYFSPLTNYLAGGFCGFMAAMLTAGLTIIGIGFLDLPSSLAGYRPYILTNGQPVENTDGGGLWIPADRFAASFFSTLSGGTFYSGTPIGGERPRLAEQAVLFHFREYTGATSASVGAPPDTVQVTGWGWSATPLKGVDDTIAPVLGEAAQKPGSYVIVVDTKWASKAGTADTDMTIRVSPTQVRLVLAESLDEGGDAELIAPIGVSRAPLPGASAREYTPINSNSAVGWGDQRGAELAWVFLVPAQPGESDPKARIRGVLLRRLPFELPAEENLKDQSLAAVLGRIQAPEQWATDPKPSTDRLEPFKGVNPGMTGDLIEINDNLPAAISKNLATSIETATGNKLINGNDTVRPAGGPIPSGVRVDKFEVYPNQACIRVPISQQRSGSLLGQIRDLAAGLGGISLVDSTGQTYEPIGYIWHKSDQVQVIKIDRQSPLRSARELPVREMAQGDTLYLYFMVPRAITITSLRIGRSDQEANLVVPR